MQEPQEANTWPVGSRPRRFSSRAVIGVFAAGLAIGVALAGLGVALAQTSSPSPSATPGTRMPGMHKGGFGHGHFGFGLFGALHGEFTTAAPGGGYQTLAVQRGQVTSVSASSITLKSEDGFSRTYTVDANTLVVAGDNGIADVKTGNTVRIMAVVSGGKARAVQIVDATTVQQSRARWWPGYREASPSPSASSA